MGAAVSFAYISALEMYPWGGVVSHVSAVYWGDGLVFNGYCGEGGGGGVLFPHVSALEMYADGV